MKLGLTGKARPEDGKLTKARGHITRAMGKPEGRRRRGRGSFRGEASRRWRALLLLLLLGARVRSTRSPVGWLPASRLPGLWISAGRLSGAGGRVGSLGGLAAGASPMRWIPPLRRSVSALIFLID